MDISLLGPLEVSINRARLKVPGLKLRTLLAVLAFNPSRIVSKDQLIDELWTEGPPKNAENSLQVHILRLRRLFSSYLGEPAAREFLQTMSSGYSLVIPAESVDVGRFTRYISQARQARRVDPGRAAHLFEKALDLWRGPALIDIGDGMTCRLAAVRLEETRITVQEEMFDAKLGLGLYQDILPELELFTMRYPLRENFCEQFMVALYRCGRQADAVDAYQRTRQRLVTELGLEPGESMRSRFQEILQQAIR